MRKHLKATRGNIFTARVTFVPYNVKYPCSLLINVAKGETKEVQDPGLVWSDLRWCSYSFLAPPGRILRFNVTLFDVATRQVEDSSYRCTELNSPVIFYDGASNEGDPFAFLCHPSNETSRFSSATSQVTVYHGRPETNASVSVLYHFSVTTKCGQIFLANGSLQTVSFNSFRDASCVFVIKASDDTQRVFLRLDFIEFPHGYFTEENSPSIVVKDGLRNDSEIIGRFMPYCFSPDRKHPHCSNQEVRSTGNAIRLQINAPNKELRRFHFSYSTEITSCGGPLRGIEGIIDKDVVNGESECSWVIESEPGNSVRLSVSLNIPESEFCEESYFEIRNDSDVGAFIKRGCRKEDFQNLEIIGQSLWMRLRIHKDENTTLSPTAGYHFRLKFLKEFGGDITPDMASVIRSPSEDDWRLAAYKIVIWRIRAEERRRLRIAIDKIDIPDLISPTSRQRFGLIFYEGLCYLTGTAVEGERCGRISQTVTGYEAPEPFTISSRYASILFHAAAGSSFSLHWESFYDYGYGDYVSYPKYLGTWAPNCGTELNATYDAQYLISPEGSIKHESRPDLPYPIR